MTTLSLTHQHASTDRKKETKEKKNEKEIFFMKHPKIIQILF